MTQAATATFVTHRHLLDTYAEAIAAGMTDAEYVGLVTELDARVAAVDGHGFAETPLVQLDTPMSRLVWAKVETGNVAGSHKARHLFGLALQSIISRCGTAGRDEPTLAIASCGNAALGAAVVARALDRDLDVFVPVDADPLVIERLAMLQANVITCEREPSAVGDPCMAGLQHAVRNGAEPFTVQGTTCPGVFDGARTIGLELAEQLTELGVEPTDLYIQVGGGAFATAVVDGLLRADLIPLPRLHPVQPLAAHPLAEAWHRLVPRLLDVLGEEDPQDARTLADLLRPAAQAGVFDRVIAEADDVMVAWPGVPTSIATGILDDMTYDWRPLLTHQLRTGGWPVLPSEADFARAAMLAASQVEPPPDPTGAAGLAGMLIDHDATDDPAVVILSGVDRIWEAAHH